MMIHEQRGGYQPMRRVDVTADDTAMDGSTPDQTYWDITKQDERIFEMDPAALHNEILFYGEMTEGGTFGCEMWGQAPNGPARVLFDITGAGGGSYGPEDSTTVLLVDDISVTQKALQDVSSYVPGDGQAAMIRFDSQGISRIWPRFYNVGGAGEVDAIRPYIRSW